MGHWGDPVHWFQSMYSLGGSEGVNDHSALKRSVTETDGAKAGACAEFEERKAEDWAKGGSDIREPMLAWVTRGLALPLTSCCPHGGLSALGAD